jgi:hypothetical protein
MSYVLIAGSLEYCRANESVVKPLKARWRSGLALGKISGQGPRGGLMP